MSEAAKYQPNWKKVATALYVMLDEIDTFSDLAKGNDKLYRNLVRREHEKRFQFHHCFDPHEDVSEFNQPSPEQMKRIDEAPNE